MFKRNEEATVEKCNTNKNKMNCFANAFEYLSANHVTSVKIHLKVTEFLVCDLSKICC